MIRRSAVVGADGVPRDDAEVSWFQGPSLYVDLRRPGRRPRRAGIRCRADLEHAAPEVLAALAAQEAFAGRCVHGADGVTRWERLVDLRPPGPHPDAGRLTWDGDVLVEHGQHEPYLEYWHPEHLDAPPGPGAGVLLRDPVIGVHGVLVRVGDRFGYARGGTEPLPGVHLPGARSPCSRPLGAPVLDVEVSLGHVDRAGRWIVEASTLPYREGADVAPSPDRDGWCTSDADRDGAPAVRLWHLLHTEGDVVALLDRGSDP